ncbi:MAG: hypothetical protein GC164_02125 [Phycisphaera sp.]|nr:hypothetical protein [Phycisphaera sp.]
MADVSDTQGHSDTPTDRGLAAAFSHRLQRGFLAALLTVGLGLVVSWFAQPPRFGNADDRLAMVIPDNLDDITMRRLQSAWNDRRCDECHDIDPSQSHPVDVIPSMRVPANLPLDQGRVTCATCHDASDINAHSQARQDHTPLLRSSLTGRAFCTQCHESNRTDHKVKHGLALGHAHMKSLTQPATDTSAFAVLGSSELDTTSAACMGCHDGTSGPGLGRSHPVGVPYRENFSARSGGGKRMRLVPIQQLDPRIILAQGTTVSCASCHSPFTHDRFMLTIPQTDGQLCRSCHERR